MSLPSVKDLLSISSRALSPDSPMVKPYLEHIGVVMARAAHTGDTHVNLPVPVRFRGRPGPSLDKTWDMVVSPVLRELRRHGYTINYLPGALDKETSTWKISWAGEESPRLGDSF